MKTLLRRRAGLGAIKTPHITRDTGAPAEEIAEPTEDHREAPGDDDLVWRKGSTNFWGPEAGCRGQKNSIELAVGFWMFLGDWEYLSLCF